VEALETHPFSKKAAMSSFDTLAKSSATLASPPAVDARAVALDWISRLSNALFTRDEARLRTLFAPVAILRDSLIFTWDLRSPAGPAAIAAHMCTRDGGSQGLVRAFALDEGPGLGPVVLDVDQPGAVSLAFTFDTPYGKGRGSARLFPRRHYENDGPDEWIADSAYMMLDSIGAHEDPRQEVRPDPGFGHEAPWEISEAERRKKIEDEPYVLVGMFISGFSRDDILTSRTVGAGQTGLMLAARFQQLGLPTLIIEKDARVGDEWRRRYRTLNLHTPKEQHTRTSSILSVKDTRK
jgi:hypothetical protein